MSQYKVIHIQSFAVIRPMQIDPFVKKHKFFAKNASRNLIGLFLSTTFSSANDNSSALQMHDNLILTKTTELR